MAVEYARTRKRRPKARWSSIERVEKGDVAYRIPTLRLVDDAVATNTAHLQAPSRAPVVGWLELLRYGLNTWETRQGSAGRGALAKKKVRLLHHAPKLQLTGVSWGCGTGRHGNFHNTHCRCHRLRATSTLPLLPQQPQVPYPTKKSHSAHIKRDNDFFCQRG